MSEKVDERGRRGRNIYFRTIFIKKGDQKIFRIMTIKKNSNKNFPPSMSTKKGGQIH
jgi:hypothetical protein